MLSKRADFPLSMAANGAQGQTLAEMESLPAGDMTIGELNRYFNITSHLPATVTEMYLKSDQIPLRPRVTLGRPFLYLIVDRETNLPIFIGTATDIGEEIE